MGKALSTIRFTNKKVNLSLPSQVVEKQIVVKDGNSSKYYLKLSNGFSIEIDSKISTVPTEEIIKLEHQSSQVFPEAIKVCPLLDPNLLPSAGNSMVANVKEDEWADQKVKGETFFTHKTAPGLVIKAPDGHILHDTKMEDMYKRRG